MRPESTNGAGGTSGGGLAVPMAWLCAEYLADEVLRAAALVAPGSLEYRAGLQALALTVHLAEEPDGPSGGWAAGRIDEWLRHTAYDRPWPQGLGGFAGPRGVPRPAQLSAQSGERGGGRRPNPLGVPTRGEHGLLPERVPNARGIAGARVEQIEGVRHKRGHGRPGRPLQTA